MTRALVRYGVLYLRTDQVFPQVCTCLILDTSPNDPLPVKIPELGVRAVQTHRNGVIQFPVLAHEICAMSERRCHVAETAVGSPLKAERL